MNGSAKSQTLLGVAARGTLVTFAGTLVGKMLSFLFRVLVTRLFGEVFFGILMICVMVVEFARTFAIIGLAKGGMRFLSVALGQGRLESLPQLFGIVFLLPFFLGLVFYWALFAGADLLAEAWFEKPELAHYLRILAIAIPFMSVIRIGVDMSRGFHTTRFATLVESLFLPTAILLLTMAAYVLVGRFDAVLFGIILANILAALLILRYLARQLRERLDKPFDLGKFLRQSRPGRGSVEILRYSFPLFLTGFTGILMTSTDVLILGRFVTVDQVGVYGAAVTIASMFSSTLMMSVNSIFAPLVATAHGQDKLDHINILYRSTTRWLFFLSLPLATAIILARQPIMAVFGDGFVSQGSLVLAILTIGQIFNCTTGGVGYVLSMTGRQKIELWVNVIAVSINVILNIILISMMGIVGAALATAVSLSILNGLRLFFVYSRMGLNPFTGKFFILFICAVIIIVMAELFCRLNDLSLGRLGLGLVSAGFLTGLIWFFGVESDDITVFRGLFRRRRCAIHKHT